MRDRGPLVEQGSPVYFVLVIMLLLFGIAIPTWGMCMLSPDTDMQYANNCLAAHGSYVIHNTENGTDRSCTLR